MKLAYKDPKKKKLQQIEIALMVLFLPVGLYFGGKAFLSYQAFTQAEALHEEASVLLHMGKNDEAIPKLEEAVELYPEYYSAWEALGVAHHSNGELEKAVEVYKKGSEALPENGNLQRELATAYHYAGRHELEYEAAKAATELPNGDPLFTQKVFERATKEREKGVTQTDPISPPELNAPPHQHVEGDGHDHEGHDHAEGEAHTEGEGDGHDHSSHEGHDHSEGDDHGKSGSNSPMDYEVQT